jgi:hypothetical protein
MRFGGQSFGGILPADQEALRACMHQVTVIETEHETEQNELTKGDLSHERDIH